MSGFPDDLRTWRTTRRLSQLDLALEADVSSRHISFLETGRARPSAEMIGRLGDALHLPLAARNRMLTLAGYTARYAARDWGDEDLAPIRDAVRHMLESHAPYPAIAIDTHWVVRDLNTPAAQLFAILDITRGSSLIDLLLSDNLPPMVENWGEVAHHAAHRLRTESAALGGDETLDRAVHHLDAQSNQPRTAAGPVVPTIFKFGDTRLSLFATIAQFGTPEDLALSELKVEFYFPADDATRIALTALSK